MVKRQPRSIPNPAWKPLVAVDFQKTSGKGKICRMNIYYAKDLSTSFSLLK